MKTVDVTGEICPRPALIVREELTEMEGGDELLVEGDYPPAEQNLRRTCERHGYTVETEDGTADTFQLRITVPEESSVTGT